MTTAPSPALKIEWRGASAWVWMDRAEVHNAFDDALIAELTATFAALDADSDAARVIVLAGAGKSFSAGADLRGMKRQAAPEHNLANARRHAALFRTIAACRKPTVARVPPDALDACVQQVVDALRLGGPKAQAAATDLLRAIADRPVDDALVEDTARRIAGLRATPEAAEGVSAFLAKRPAAWTPTD